MPKSQRHGLFIVFEGTDGSGMSTQAAILTERLRNEGFKVLLTKEPTSNIIGGLIRGQLTHDWSTDIKTLQLLFAADRGHHLEKEIIPALEAGYIVISDRYYFTSFAYTPKEYREWIMAVNSQFPTPDLTIWVKVAPKEAARRIHQARFGIELYERQEKFRQVAKAYGQMAKKFANFYVVSGEQPIETVGENVYRVIKPLLARVSRSG